MTETSVVIKTSRAHLASYVQLQADLLAFGHSGVRVCVPEADLGVFDSIVAPELELLSAEFLLRLFGWAGGLNDNWYSQQLYKLLLVASCETEACWVLDSNTLLVEALPDPWCQGRVVLSLGELLPIDQDWFDSSARFLGLPTKGPPVAPVNQPLRRSVVRALFEWIARAHSVSPVSALIAGMVVGARRGNPLWTEYGLYRGFAFHVARGAHLYRDGIRDVAYFRHDQEGQRLNEWLDWLRGSRPQMVKVYARRPGFRMNERAFRYLCDRIRACR